MAIMDFWYLFCLGLTYKMTKTRKLGQIWTTFENSISGRPKSENTPKTGFTRSMPSGNSFLKKLQKCRKVVKNGLKWPFTREFWPKMACSTTPPYPRKFFFQTYFCGVSRGLACGNSRSLGQVAPKYPTIRSKQGSRRAKFQKVVILKHFFQLSESTSIRNPKKKCAP